MFWFCFTVIDLFSAHKCIKLILSQLGELGLHCMETVLPYILIQTCSVKLLSNQYLVSLLSLTKKVCINFKGVLVSELDTFFIYHCLHVWLPILLFEQLKIFFHYYHKCIIHVPYFPVYKTIFFSAKCQPWLVVHFDLCKDFSRKKCSSTMHFIRFV